MNLINGIKSAATIATHFVRRKSPEILMVTGVVSFVATVVTASKETVKAQDILDEFHDNKEAIKECREEKPDEYTDDIYRHDVIVTYSKLGLGLAKNYLPAIGFGVLTVACFFGAYGILKKRNAALIAAYTALNSAFTKYRQRVIEDKGEDADVYYMTGQKPKKITEVDEDGNKTEHKEVKGDVDPALRYMFKFGKYKENGEKNLQWTDNKNYNRMQLEGKMDCLTDLMYHRTVFDDRHNVIKPGYVFLNETRSACGEDYNSDGQIVGNLYSEHGEPCRNGYINFNIIEGTEIDPETGKEIDCYWINPNVDGPIWDLLDAYKRDNKKDKREKQMALKKFRKETNTLLKDPNTVIHTF